MSEKCGEKTEVFSRVVGYFRPVNNWNSGKKEEFEERKDYTEKKFKNKKEVANMKGPGCGCGGGGY